MWCTPREKVYLKRFQIIRPLKHAQFIFLLMMVMTIYYYSYYYTEER